MEKLSLTPKRLVIGGIVVGLAVVVALFLRETTGSPGRPAGEQTVASTAGAKVRKPAPSISLPGRQSPDTGEPPVMDDDEVLESIVKKDKKLGLFMRYYKAVLPDEQTRDEYASCCRIPP